MSHWKRKKCRRSILCSICTPYRWRGNSLGGLMPRFKPRYIEQLRVADEERRELQE
jgi:hypothetical protein